MDRQKAEALVTAERSAFAKLDCMIFGCGRVIYASDKQDQELLGVLPTTDPFEVIAAIGTSGPNYGVFTSDIVAELKKLSKVAPFHVTAICPDSIQLEFIKTIPKSQAKKWAVRLSELCPDLIHQGFENTMNLREHLLKGGELFLWWD